MMNAGMTTARIRRRAEHRIDPRVQVFAVFVIATLARGTSVFRYDAVWYWTAARSVVGSVAGAPGGYWDLRGVLTSLVYAPAAAFSAVIGPRDGRFAVLLQNAVVLGWLAAFLLPRIVERSHALPVRGRWICAVLTWIALAGFAPYPIMDIYAVIACFVVVSLLQRGGYIALAAAGIAAGVAINLRPAYLVVLAMIAVVALVWRRVPGLLFIAGAILGVAPQLIFNVIRSGKWSFSPPLASTLVSVQTSSAAYLVRYDTIGGARVPQQSYCSPQMARAIGDHVPTTMRALGSTFLQHVPTASLFSLEKVAASLHWPVSAPFGNPTAGVDAVFAFFVTAVVVVGVGALVVSAVRDHESWTPARWEHAAVLLAVLVGTIVTIAGSAMETRFALPLVFLGIMGCTTLSHGPARELWTSGRRWLVTAAVLVVATSVVAHIALSNPAPRGLVDPAVCRSLGK